MVHEAVNIEHWKTLFPLQRLRDEARAFVLSRQAQQPDQYRDEAAVQSHIDLMYPGGRIVTGPADLSIVEQIRDEVFRGSPPPNGTPVDVFVFARGEPTRREVTKVGGLPYWPRTKPWPTVNDEPASFIAQISFADSRDLVGSVPEDVLVLFGDMMDPWETPSEVVSEWLPLGLTDLVTEEEIPDSQARIAPCYGTIFRSFDYPDADGLFDNYSQAWVLNVYEGTKIGGEPRWIQYPEDLPGRFLGTLGSIDVTMGEPHPFANVAEPVPPGSNDYLMFGDVGSLYLFAETDGTLHWAEQSY